MLSPRPRPHLPAQDSAACTACLGVGALGLPSLLHPCSQRLLSLHLSPCFGTAPENACILHPTAQGTGRDQDSGWWARREHSHGGALWTCFKQMNAKSPWTVFVWHGTSFRTHFRKSVLACSHLSTDQRQFCLLFVQHCNLEICHQEF